MEKVQDYKTEALSGIRVFGGLGADGLEKLQKILDVRDYQIAEPIITQNEEPEHVYFILSGSVQVQIIGKGFVKLDAGEVFGEASLVQSEHFLPPGWRLQGRTASVIGATDCRIAVAHVDHLTFFLREYPSVREAIAKIAKERQSK